MIGQLTLSDLRKAERDEGVWRMKDQEWPSGMARLGEWWCQEGSLGGAEE